VPKKNKTISLNTNSGSFELDIKEATVGPNVIDLKRLYGQTGLFTFDPSYSATASCESYITYIDGNEGILEYRGYPIEQLAELSTYLEVAYLLFNGELPSENSLEDFRSKVKTNMTIPEQTKKLFHGLDKDSHPMAMLTTAMASLSSIYHDEIDVKNHEDQKKFFFNVLGKTPILVASIFNHRNQTDIGKYDEALSYSENILRLFFGGNSEYKIETDFAKALDILMILHADHEQNCSTSTVRLVGSSRANLFASISTGIAALWGPLHGGANQAVLEMLQQIHIDGGDVQKFVKLAKDKDSSFRLMGFGHRVYKNFDPRATILKEYCDKILKMLGTSDPLLDIAKQLEEAALTDEYFIDRNLYPNVDFYSGIIYKALGFPTDMFTVLFSLGRLPGWIAHWLEMHNSASKIGRPRQIYTGHTEREYVALSQRN